MLPFSVSAELSRDVSGMSLALDIEYYNDLLRNFKFFPITLFAIIFMNKKDLETFGKNEKNAKLMKKKMFGVYGCSKYFWQRAIF